MASPAARRGGGIVGGRQDSAAVWGETAMSSSQGRDRPEVRVCRAIRLLAGGQSEAEVARAVHALPSTLARWASADDFCALVDCLREAGQMRDTLETLSDLTPGAITALRRALEGDDTRLAVQAAHEVLERVGPLAARQRAIRVEYVNRDGQPVSTSPWSDRHPAASGAVQGGGVRAPLRENGDGQDPAG